MTDHKLIKAFEKKYKLKVILIEYDSIDVMVALLESNPGDFDVVVVNSEVLKSLIKMKLIAKLDKKLISSLVNISEDIQVNLIYESLDNYAVPYLSGTTAIAYNKKYVTANINSWSAFWNTKYMGKNLLIDESSKIIYPILKYSGFSSGSKYPEEIELIKVTADKLSDNRVKFVSRYDIMKMLNDGSAWIAQIDNWMISLNNNSDLIFVYPKEGYPLWTNYFTISTMAENRDAAHKLINYMLKPEVSTANAAMFKLKSPLTDALLSVDDDDLEDININPPDLIVQNGEVLESPEMNSEYQSIITDLKGKSK